ncbi:MAG: hypothetical protein IJT87_08885 [Ruminiclostridium sp.]|nr:hypothetical protein [Ruminiclostridium sp.]
MEKAEEIQVLSQNEEFLKKAYRAALIPCMLSIVSGCANIIADGILVGQRIGVTGLSAINLCVPVYLLLCVIGSFFVSGTAICASNQIGKGNTERAQKYYGIALSACIVFSGIMTVVGIFLSDAITSLLCSDPEVYPMVKDYTQVMLVGAAPKILIYMPFWFLRLDGKNKTVTVMMAVMGIGNVLLDILYLFVMDMGVFGAALASAIATGIACVVGFVSQHSGKATFVFRPAVPDKKSFAALAKAGTPAALNNLMQTFRLLFINSLLMSYGGNEAVAVFTVVNGIAAFSEAVTSGVPQAASAMLGVYNGEHDNKSAAILLKLEFVSGAIYAAAFGVVITAGAGVIAMLYGINVPMYIPMFCLALSLIPCLWNSILSGYYSVSGRAMMSSAIIFMRAFVFTVLSLWGLTAAGIIPWLFLPLAELLTTGVWFIITRLVSGRSENVSRYMLMNTALDKSGNVINFSMISDNEAICGACERITEFCENNGMLPKQTMRVSLALEELMTVIAQDNAPNNVNFDIRVFSLQGTIGIRIRYDGKDLDPLQFDPDDERYMGVSMIQNLVEETIYKRIFGSNSLMILI